MSRLEEFRRFTQEVKDANPIDEVVSLDAKLEQRGKNLVCNSPLRVDNDPSFYVYPEQGSWYDFGTGDGGDVVTYVEKRFGYSFRESVDWLAARVGLKWDRGAEDPILREALDQLVERRSIYSVLAEAMRFYHRSLPLKIRKHITETWGITDDTIDQLQIGWASGGDVLVTFLKSECGFKTEMIERTGLVFKSRGDALSDFYNGRIVFPYIVGGEFVYSIGRRVEGHTPDVDWERGKYKKHLTCSDKHPYVSTAISNEWFYGEDWARKKLDTLLITEGITDCIVAVQSGQPTTSPVATRFSKVTSDKLVKLTSNAQSVVVGNDNEENRSGEKGALDTAEVLYRHGRNVKIAEWPRPEGLAKIDLAELVRTQGPDALKAAIAASTPFVDALLERLPKDIDPAEVGGKIAPIVELVAQRPAIEREGQVARIAKRFGITKTHVSRMVRAFAPPEPPKEIGLRGRVFESEECCYYVTNGNTSENISTFSIRPRELIEHERGEVLRVDYHTRDGTTISGKLVEPTAWTSRRSFVGQLPGMGLSWTGNDDNVQGVRALCAAAQVPRRRGTVLLGYHETSQGPVWVTDQGVLGPDGYQDESEIIYVAQTSPLAGRLRYDVGKPDEVKSIAREVLPRLLELNKPDVILAILGWFYAAPLTPLIRKALGHFPLLWIFGSQGSGKSTIIREIAWPLLGVDRVRDPFSCTDTEFALTTTMSATISVPIPFDEYKPSDMGKGRTERAGRLFRRVYGGEIEQRGTTGLQLRQWHLSAPVCVIGEAPPQDPATLERLILAMPSKNALTPERQRAFDTVTRFDLGALAGPYIQHVLRTNFDEKFLTARKICDALIRDKILPPRVRDNVLTMVFGLHMFDTWAESLGVQLGDDIDLQGVIDTTISNVLVQGEESGMVKDAFDRFFESLAAYAHMGTLVEDKHYVFYGDELRLHLPVCYETYLEARRATGQEDVTNGMRALRRLAQEKFERDGSYIKSISAETIMGGRKVKNTVAIDPARIPAGLDVAEFPCKAKKWHAGAGWEGEQGTN